MAQIAKERLLAHLREAQSDVATADELIERQLALIEELQASGVDS